MSKPDRAVLWLEADEALPVVESAGSGSCVVATRKSPDRDENAPNEDGAALVSWTPKGCVLMLADGLGGHGEGEFAADLVLSKIVRRLRREHGDPAAVQGAVIETLQKANLELIEREGAAGTTILVVTVDKAGLRSYHAGDSELLVVGQRGKIKFQTVSHSPVGYAVEAGVIDRKEGFQHEDRHLISNYVGMEGMRVEMATAMNLSPRDTVVLGSDGLWDNLRVHEVAEVVRKGPLKVAAGELMRRVASRMAGDSKRIEGKPDDATVILYRDA
jgi:serine/threonine protein phosphatase PrpC